MSEFNTLAFMSLDIWHNLATDVSLFLWLVPMIFLYEMPLMLIVVSGVIGWHWQTFRRPKVEKAYRPKVSCIITCYAEKEAVRQTIATLAEQDYPGEMEIIAVVDGAVQNAETFEVAKAAAAQCRRPGREIIVLPKWQRGGRVSTLNAGLARASGELVMNADADTSFDNDMVSQIVPLFADPNVPAVGGSLRVRNVDDSLWTRMQAIEYLISMQGGKTGLGHWNLLNNISGAFGAFRRDLLVKIGGWDTHTAEDLDLTLRFKQYFGRHPNWRIPFATLAIGHTDAPMDIKTLVWQRLRWDGDLLFLYFRKHWPAFTPGLLGGRHLRLYSGLRLLAKRADALCHLALQLRDSTGVPLAVFDNHCPDHLPGIFGILAVLLSAGTGSDFRAATSGPEAAALVASLSLLRLVYAQYLLVCLA
ncbi:glycosyltransferase family 2 protein [Shewanella algae]|uniref:glycosyltransferase family 2 protein n=1 Tax=Shewanella algae TaxID=38313 RepID=UPI0034D43A44